MRKYLPRLVLIGLLSLVAWPQTCLACYCVFPEPADATKQADIVFRGGAIIVGEHPTYHPKGDGSVEVVTRLRTVFLVNTGWKGPLSPIVSVFSGVTDGAGVTIHSSCDMTYNLGQEYLVFARRGQVGQFDPLALGAWSCSGTQPIVTAAPFLATLGPGTTLATPANPLAAGVLVGAFDLAVK